MAFFSELIESFIPTVAFAEEPKTVSKVTPEEPPIEEYAQEAAPSVDEVVETQVEEAAAPAEETSAEKATSPIEEVPAEEAPAEEAPVQEAPVEEAPVEEAPSEESNEEETPAESEEEEDEEEDEEDEDEEEGTADPLDKLRAECATLPSIKPYLHHYEECVERVTKAQEDPDYDSKEYKEDCVEEFFHLQHHINDCVQPRLFSKLK